MPRDDHTPPSSEGTPHQPSGGPAPKVPLFASLQGILRELPGLVSDRVEIFSLEMHRAGLVFARIAALALAAAVCVATAWIAFWAGVAFVMAALGAPWLATVALVLLVNAFAAWLAVRRIWKLAPRLELPVTRRHLTFKSRAADPEADLHDEQTGDQNLASAVMDEPPHATH